MIKTKLISFLLNAVTGNQEITGVGFKPKAIIFFHNSQSAAGFGANKTINHGMATAATEQAGISSVTVDALSAQGNCYHTNAACIISIDNTGAPTRTAALVSFDDNGFTINVSVASGTPVIQALCLGGDELQAKVVQFTTRTSTGVQNVTGAGFLPQSVFAFCNINSLTPPDDRGGGFGQLSFAASTTQQVVTAWNSGFSGSSVDEKVQSAADFMRWSNGGSIFWNADFNGFTADGFDLNWTTANGTARYAWALCLKGAQFAVGSFNQPTSGGRFNNIANIGFKPKGAILMSFNNITSSAVIQDVSVSFGAIDQFLSRGFIWAGDLDNANPTQSDMNLDQTKVMKMISSGTLTVNASADVYALTPDGIELNWDSVDATAREVLYWLIGENNTVHDIVDENTVPFSR